MPAVSVDGMALEKLGRMFSLSTTFQNETGGSEASAITHVYYGVPDGFQDQATCPRPLVMLSVDDRIDRFMSGGDRNYLRANGKLALTLIRNVQTSSPNSSAEYLNQLKWMSQVLSEVAGLSAVDDTASPYSPAESHLAIARMDLDAFGLVNEELATTLVQFYGMEATVYWGDDHRDRF